MSERNFFAELKRRNVYKLAVAYAVVAWLLTEVSAETSPSLAGRSNEDLLAIIRGGETNRPPATERPPLALPSNFWSMPPREAALTVVLHNSSEETKQRVTFSIADPAKTQVPERGEVGIRWDAPGSGPMAGGSKVLRAAGEKSHLAYSAVELAGEATKKQIKAAVDRTKTVPLAADVARHTFQVIWWLRHLEQKGEPETQSIFVTHQTRGTFWITPGFRARRDVTVLNWPLGAETGEEFDDERHAGFAWFLISEAAKHQPHDISETTAILGEGVYPDEALKFLRTQPRPRSEGETEAWITRTLKILRSPRYRSWRWFAINNLVPWQDPMRYRDTRIDAALRGVVDEKLGEGAGAGKNADEWNTDSVHAAQHLAWRDCSDIFPALLAALRAGRDRLGADDLLTAAALLGSRHPELRPPVVEYLHGQLSDIGRSKHGSWKLFDTSWRFEFVELKPLLEKLATANADVVEDELGTAQISPARVAVRQFHGARKVMLTWSEPDPVTKLKLDSLLEASSTGLFQPAEHLRRQFEQLREPEKQTFREFVEWMKEQKLPYNWSPERVNWAISPEALAAAE
jgi:hypothetical protein